MLVSALLTSVGINTGLCFLFFTLYSVLRKQPSNFEVYVPRLIAGGQSKRGSRFNLDRLIPSPGWVKKAWNLTEEQILSTSGLDAVVFMRIIIFSLRVFAFAGVIGIFILLPVNCSGDALTNVDLADLSNSSLDVFTISNVNSGSKLLWIHFCAVYAVTAFVCFLLYYEFKYISAKRMEYFYSSKPQPHQFTILVRSIPLSGRSSVSDSVERFFREYHPATYLCHVVVRRTNKLRNLLHETRKLYRRIIHLQAEPSHKHEKCCCCGLFKRRVDLVNHYEKKLEDLEENVRLERSEVSLAGDGGVRACEEDADPRGFSVLDSRHVLLSIKKCALMPTSAVTGMCFEVRAAFVSFSSRYAAATASHMHQSINPTHWLTEEAPEPIDVYWPFFSTTFMRRWICKLVVVVACILLTILFLIPVLVVQGLTNLSQLELWFPFLKSILTLTFVSQIITGYLPSLILQLFLKVVPPIMEFLSSLQGFISHSAIEKSACNKVLWFTIWNVFFATVFSGTALYQISIFLEPKTIPSRLAVSVPAQASFFIAYVVTSGWTSTSSELFRIIPFICSLVTRPFVKISEDEFEAPSIPYHRDIPRILFFGLLGITYFFLAPLILPFLLIYLCLAYIIFRNQFLNVYAPKYETAGKFWPIVHNSMIFSLVLMHAIAVGIFTLKKLSLASTLIFPLPILTLLFNEYCRKRFLPIFIAYSAEALITKDRGDQDDPSMGEFFDRLVTAYQDPALLPVHFSARSDNLNAPLITSAEV